MIEARRIETQAFYTDAGLRSLIGAKDAPLDRARRSGALKFTRASGKRLYLGEWVQSWLAQSPEPVGKGGDTVYA